MAFTFFFRDMYTLDLVEQHVIPNLRNRRYLDIWDAGCATGAEPYTLAILLRENMGQFMFRNVRIHATDINGQFGETISKGIYPAEQVGRIPEQVLGKYFSKADDSGAYQLDESIRKSISFLKHDLTSLKPIREGFGLILCKNVLLHIKPEQRIDVIKMFRDALSPGGYLAVEQTQKLPDEARDWFKPVAGFGPVFQRC